MYRCSLCAKCSRPYQPKLRHLVYRLDGSIAREIPVCWECKTNIASGATIEELSYMFQNNRAWELSKPGHHPPQHPKQTIGYKYVPPQSPEVHSPKPVKPAPVKITPLGELLPVPEPNRHHENAVLQKTGQELLKEEIYDQFGIDGTSPVGCLLHPPT